jgi:uncharacterized Zn finger protein (UPF0148 family)
MLIRCPSCEWKFYHKDKEHTCPICGDYISYIIEVDDLEEYQEEDLNDREAY